MQPNDATKYDTNGQYKLIDNPCWYGDRTAFPHLAVGFELEVEFNHSSDLSYQAAVLNGARTAVEHGRMPFADEMGWHPPVAFRRDCSLKSPYGVEAVTAPLPYMEACELGEMMAMSAESYKGETHEETGLHISINGRQWDTVHRGMFNAFWNCVQNARMLEKVCRRDGHHWAPKHECYSLRGYSELCDRQACSCCGSRFEVRLFKSTTDGKTLRGSIQFTRAVADWIESHQPGTRTLRQVYDLESLANHMGNNSHLYPDAISLWNNRYGTYYNAEVISSL